jgi:hypothetical protein
MGVLIGLGLVVVFAAGLTVWRSPSPLAVAILSLVGSAVVWLVWAENQYRNFDFCPWGTHVEGHPTGHPVLIGFGLALVSGVITARTRWKRDSHGWAAALGLMTGVLVVVALLVVAFFFGAGLRCED